MPPPDPIPRHRRALSASSLASADAPADLPDRPRHPYHRMQSDLDHATAEPASLSSSTDLRASGATLVDSRLLGAASSSSSLARRAAQLSPSESGTEADDEGSSAGLFFFKALPAPPFHPRKGLRGLAPAAAQEPREGGTPLLTPTKLDGEVLRLSDVGIREPGRERLVVEEEHEEERVGRSKRVRRRRAEIVRRLLEVGLMAGAGAAVLWRQGAWWVMDWGERGAFNHQVSVGANDVRGADIPAGIARGCVRGVSRSAGATFAENIVDLGASFALYSRVGRIRPGTVHLSYVAPGARLSVSSP